MNTLAFKLWSKVARETSRGCWERECGNRQGVYTHVYLGLGLGNAPAHRVAWELVNGTFPRQRNGQFKHACHHCDNPSCVNPVHIFAGMPCENAQDCREKGRSGSKKGALKRRINVLINNNLATNSGRITPLGKSIFKMLCSGESVNIPRLNLNNFAVYKETFKIK